MSIGGFPPATSARNVLISGLEDSLGLYRPADGYENHLADQWLGILGSETQGTELFGRLSWGHRRLLMIGRGMIKHPPLLLLDEPLQGLDEVSRKAVLDLTERLIRETTTSVIDVSHRPAEAPPSRRNHLRLVPTGYSGPSRAVYEDR